MTTDLKTLERERRVASLAVARATYSKADEETMNEVQRRYAVARCKAQIMATLKDYPPLDASDRRELRNFIRDLP